MSIKISTTSKHRNIKKRNQIHIGTKREKTRTHTNIGKKHFRGCNQQPRKKERSQDKTVNRTITTRRKKVKRNSTKLKSRKREYCVVIQANAKRFSQIRLHLWDTLIQYRFLKPANNFILGVLLAVGVIQLFYRWICANFYFPTCYISLHRSHSIQLQRIASINAMLLNDSFHHRLSGWEQ